MSDDSPNRKLVDFRALRCDPGYGTAIVSIDDEDFAYYDEDDGRVGPSGPNDLLVGWSAQGVRTLSRADF